MGLVTISGESLSLTASDAQARAWCAQLEAGDILYFPETPVPIPQEDLAFLLGLQQADSSLHKNIAYKPKVDVLSGVNPKTHVAAEARLQSIMREYSKSVVAFLTGFCRRIRRNGRWTTQVFVPGRTEARSAFTEAE